MSKYKITNVKPIVYLDKLDNAINGFKVTVYLTEFDETQFIQVPTTTPDLVKAAIEKLIADRQALADLGV